MTVKRTLVFTLLFMLPFLLVSCSEDTNTSIPNTAPTLLETDSPTSLETGTPTSLETNTPTPQSVVTPASSQVEKDTVFTRDISTDEKVQAVKQIYETGRQYFAAWNTFTFDDWKAVYQPTLDRVLETDNIFDFYMELKRFVALLNDEHSQVEFPQAVYDDLWVTPINISYINDGYYITSGEASALHELPQFSKIVKIDGVEVDTYMEQYVFPYIWHAKKNTAMGYYGSFIACCGQASSSQVFEVITPENKTLTASMKRVPFKQYGSNWVYTNMDIDAKQEDIFSSNLLTVKRIDDDFIYVEIRTFTDSKVVSEFEAHLDILKQAKGIIIDVRNNYGGRSTYAAQIAQHFITDQYPDIYVEYSVYNDKTDSYSLLSQTSKNHSGLGDITAPVVILQGYKTASSAEHFLDFMSHADNSITIGTESAGSTGDPKIINLPEGGTAKITHNKIARFDKTPVLNIGIQPNIFVENTIQDYINGLDAILNYSLTELKKDVQ